MTQFTPNKFNRNHTTGRNFNYTMQESRRSGPAGGSVQFFSPRQGLGTIINSYQMQGTKQLVKAKQQKAETLKKVRMNAVEKARHDLTNLVAKEQKYALN
jgi:hypothetical protein